MKFTLASLAEAKAKMDKLSPVPIEATLFGTPEARRAVIDSISVMHKSSTYGFDCFMGIRFIEKKNQILSGWLISDKAIVEANRISEFDLIKMQSDPCLRFIR